MVRPSALAAGAVAFAISSRAAPLPGTMLQIASRRSNSRRPAAQATLTPTSIEGPTTSVPVAPLAVPTHTFARRSERVVTSVWRSAVRLRCR
jgi:hypothetical protein